MGSTSETVVDVQISVLSDTLARENFGTLMVVGHTSAFVPRVKTFAGVDEVAAVFTNAGDVNRKALEAAFAQDPRPAKVKFGRRGLPPTRTITLTCGNATQGFVYSFTVDVFGGAAVVRTPITYTVPASATTTSVATAIAALINALTGVAATASAAVITATAESAGLEFAISYGDRLAYEALLPEDTTTDPGMATDLDAIKAADADWYGLALAVEGKAESLATAAWAEAAGVLYVPATSSAGVYNDTANNLCDTITGASYTRTARPILVINTTRSFGGIRMLARALTYSPAEISWAYKSLAGMLPDNHSGAALATAEANGTVLYTTVAGKPVTFGPWAWKDGSGEWMDVRHGLDWLKATIRSDLLAVLVGRLKVPYTQAGIDLMESTLKGSLAQAEEFVIEKGWTTSTPKVAAVTMADKSARTLNKLSFAATLQGAITKTKVRGTVTV